MRTPKSAIFAPGAIGWHVATHYPSFLKAAEEKENYYNLPLEKRLKLN